MGSMTLKHLRYFAAVAAHKHFGNAAESCGVSQPALSLQMKELEAIVGVALIERAARTINLTPVGEKFLTHAEVVLSRVHDLEELGRANATEPKGRLRLGVIPTVAPYLLPNVLRYLSATYPALEVYPREAVTSSLVARVLISQLDAAIISLPILDPALKELALFDEPFFLARTLADADKPAPTPFPEESMQLWLLEEGHCFRDQALSFCEDSGLPPRHIMEGTSLTTLVQMVGAGNGATLLPKMALPLEMRTAPIAVTAFPNPAPMRTIGMVWRKTSPLGNQFNAIAEIVRSIAKSDSQLADETLQKCQRQW